MAEDNAEDEDDGEGEGEGEGKAVLTLFRRSLRLPARRRERPWRLWSVRETPFLDMKSLAKLRLKSSEDCMLRRKPLPENAAITCERDKEGQRRV